MGGIPGQVAGAGRMIDDIERGFLDLLGPDDYATLLELGVRRRFPSGTAEVACIPVATFNDFLDATPNAMRYLLVDVASRLRLRIRHQLGADIVIRDLDRVRGRAVR